MEKENQNNQEQWLKAFVDREEDFDYEAFCEMMRSLDNEDLREEFERVRRLTALVANKAKMWKQVQSRMNKNSRYQVKRYLKYAAIIVAFVLAGGTWWMVKENPEEIISVELSETSMLSPGTPKAYILFSSGQRMDLTTTEHDTMIMEKGMQVRVGSSGKISYVPGDSGSILKQEIVYNTIVVPRGGEYKLELADGTLVWLNSDSELRYPVKFAGSQRDVWLKGEGYFEVARNIEMPFYVKTKELQVRVLGTKFNFRDYPEDKEVVVSLLEGRIVLNNQLQREEELLLLPNEQVILDKRVKTMKKEWKRDGINIEWITGRLFFDEIPLPEVAQILERNYGVRIKFANDALKKIRFYGNFNKNGQSVRDILEALSATEKVHYTLNDKEIILY